MKQQISRELCGNRRNEQLRNVEQAGENLTCNAYCNLTECGLLRTLGTLLSRLQAAVLLAASGLFFVSAASAQSFTSFDARSMALGGTGVASSNYSEAPFFNPALLSATTKPESDKFFMSVQTGARLVDRDGFIDGVNHYQDNDALNVFEKALTNFNRRVDNQRLSVEDIDRLSSATNELLEDFEGLSDRPVRAGMALGITFAKPGRFGIAGFGRQYAVGGGKVEFADADRNLVNSTLDFGRATVEIVDLVEPYVEFVRDNSDQLQASYDQGGFDALEIELRSLLETSNLADNSEELVSLLVNFHETYLASATVVEDVEQLLELPDYAEEVQSSIEVEGSWVTELGVSFSYLLNERRQLTIGTNIKSVRFDTYDFRALVQDFDADNLSSGPHRLEHTDSNVDFGISGLLTDRVRVGIVGRNLISRDYATVRGNTIELRPQVRAGFAWELESLTLSADVDLTSNEPLGFDADKQYVGLGIEKRWSHLALRGGVRHNVIDDSQLFSLGAAVRLGPTQIELAAAGANDAAAMALQFGMGF